MTHIDFIGKRRIYYAISITLILLGILISMPFAFGIKLDIQFKGGTIIQYTYDGTVNQTKVSEAATKSLGMPVTVYLLEKNPTTKQRIDLELALSKADKSLTDAQQSKLYTDLKSAFPSNNLVKYQSNTVPSETANGFFQRGILAVLLASGLIIIYIWIRFRNIGGLPAGITAFIALVHDLLMAFAAFSIFRIPLNENFIAVLLTILGYSINDTIVIYDRIRENRREIGTKMPFRDIVNKSINQSFSRSINTTLVVFVSIAVVLVFSIINNLQSITDFALPMMVGVVTGCYSTICIAGPLWTTWEEYKEKKRQREHNAAVAARNARVERLRGNSAVAPAVAGTSDFEKSSTAETKAQNTAPAGKNNAQRPAGTGSKKHKSSKRSKHKRH